MAKRKTVFTSLMSELRHIKTKRSLNNFCKKITATDNLSSTELDVLRQYIEDAYENHFNTTLTGPNHLANPGPAKLYVPQEALDYIRKRADGVVLIKSPKEKIT